MIQVEVEKAVSIDTDTICNVMVFAGGVDRTVITNGIHYIGGQDAQQLWYLYLGQRDLEDQKREMPGPTVLTVTRNIIAYHRQILVVADLGAVWSRFENPGHLYLHRVYPESFPVVGERLV